jgi:superfamily II DNA/RNA helicase
MSKSTDASFENLNLSKPILNALAKSDYTEPTPIQEEGIPLVLAGKDIIAKAPTGTGKTAVFVLPALELLLKAKTRIKPRVLILTPTRELATQITDVIYKLGKDFKVNVASILGGMPYREQLRKLSRPHDIIVATPGRLLDYMNRGNMDFSQIEMLVLDEADRMLDMGFIDDVKMIANATPQNRQTLLFTATLDGRLVKLAGNMLNSPEHIEVEHKKETLDNITQRLYVADDAGHKTRLLQHLLESENVYKAIVFSATKKNADELAKQLRLKGYSATAMHGDMRQHKRNTTITQFKSGKIQLLIATDVAARGIDVNDLSHVFIYDLSRFAEDHVHRIGRTGRAGKKGTAISFASPADGIHLQKIERMIKHSIPRSVVAGLEPRKSLDANARRTSSKPGKFSGKSSGKFSKSSRAGEGRYASKPASKSNGGFREHPARSRSRDDENYTSKGRSNHSEGYASRGRASSGHSESYPPRGRSGNSESYTPRSRGRHSEESAFKPKLSLNKPAAERTPKKSFGPRSEMIRKSRKND